MTNRRVFPEAGGIGRVAVIGAGVVGAGSCCTIERSAPFTRDTWARPPSISLREPRAYWRLVSLLDWPS